MKNKELRNFGTEFSIEKRMEGETEVNVIVGYAAVFDKRSDKIGGDTFGFYEKISKGAFDDVMSDDVRGLFNHDMNQVLGRTKSGTMRLTKDDFGLRYEIDLPNTSFANDLRESINRGDIDSSSFGFIVDSDRWDLEGDDEVRTILKFKRLFDVSPVTFPAYPDTTVAKRSLDQATSEQVSKYKTKVDNSEKKAKVLKAELKALDLNDIE